VGLFSTFLASKVKRLVGIELSPEACNDFINNLDEFDIVSLYEASAEEVLCNVSFKPDAVIVDPLGEGLGRKTVEGIVSQEASYVVYISCDPATLARDIKRFCIRGLKTK
jgi:23S rRNA (uracil1939-C5)-methyltransferase